MDDPGTESLSYTNIQDGVNHWVVSTCSYSMIVKRSWAFSPRSTSMRTFSLLMNGRRLPPERGLPKNPRN
jgi:hypothetical protein